MHSFQRDFPADVRYIQTLHESPAVGAADGYAQATRRPALANVDTCAGLSNAMSSCGSQLRLIAFVTAPEPVAHLDEPTEPSRIAPARGSPAWDLAPELAPLPAALTAPTHRGPPGLRRLDFLSSPY